MSKIMKWCENHMPIILLLFTIVSGTIGVLLNIYGTSNALIIGLLIINSIDLIAIITGYLERFAKSLAKLEKIAEDKAEVNYSFESCDYKKFVSQAKNSIFCSGVGISFLSDYDLQNTFSKINPRVPINFAVVDCESNDVMTSLVHFFGISEDNWKSLRKTLHRDIECLKNKHNITVAFLDVFVPISYFAIDYKKETEFSFIQAKHYLLNKQRNDIDVFYCTVRPGTELYKHYRNQILLLETSAGALANRFK